MTDLVDSECIAMPEDDVGRKVFTTRLDFEYDWEAKDIPPTEVEVTVNIPEYCTGSGMGCETEVYEFEYDSCGYLSASLPEMFNEFLTDYDDGYSDLDIRHLRLLRGTLSDFVQKLDKKIQEEEVER